MKTYQLAGLLVLLAIVSRLVPHIPNCTPLLAIALFSGSKFENKWLAFTIPLLGLILSDLLLGWSSNLIVGYLCFAVMSYLGRYCLNSKNTLVFALFGSCLFFIVTNFVCWISSGMYENSITGIILCYEMAIPFFLNSLLGDVFYTGVIFGIFSLVSRTSLVKA